MSSYKRWTLHPVKDEWEVAMWLDDALGPHLYGVMFDGDDKTYDPREIDFKTDPNRPLPEDDIQLANVVEGPEPEVEYDEFARTEIKEHQLAAINWLIRRCENQFVRAWLVQERDQLERAGTTPEYY